MAHTTKKGQRTKKGPHYGRPKGKPPKKKEKEITYKESFGLKRKKKKG